MIGRLAPTIFGYINARNYAPEKVAKTFVPSRHFETLTASSHNLVVGPRGSGKTTLLKMLQTPALEAWRHPRADEFRQKVDFTGVFIPTDRIWERAVKALVGQDYSREHGGILARALFTSQVLHRLIDAINYRCHPPSDPSLVSFRRTPIEDEMEASFVKEMSTAWRLTPRIASLLSLKAALATRISDTVTLVEVERHLSAKGRAERLAQHEHLFFNLLESIAVAIEVFGDLTHTQGERWALLLDELELLPGDVTHEVMEALRGRNELLFYKCSLAPFDKHMRIAKSIVAELPGHDFEYVMLWYAHRRDGRPFCRDLLQGMLAQVGLGDLDPDGIFGKPEPEMAVEVDSEGPQAEGVPDRLVALFERMAGRDPSVLAFLDHRGLTPAGLRALRGDDRAAVIRKCAPLLRIREEFTKPTGPVGIDEADHAPTYRSRKAIPLLYAGASSLFDMLEGNPRWFLATMGPLVVEYLATRTPVPPARQLAAVAATIDRFLALLRTIPCPYRRSATDRHRGIDAAIDVIGGYFHHEIVTKPFNPDPPGSFRVDHGVRQDFLMSLGEALNAGAIIFVPDDSTTVALDRLDGQRFRLSYLLAPHYRIPIQLMRWVSLSKIHGDVPPSDQAMLPLFEPDDATKSTG